MSPSAPIMAAGSDLMISIQTGQVNHGSMEPTQGPNAGELTRSRSNMPVSALVSTWLTAACIGSGIAPSIVSLICQQVAIYNRWPLLIGQAVCQWTLGVVLGGQHCIYPILIVDKQEGSVGGQSVLLLDDLTVFNKNIYKLCHQQDIPLFIILQHLNNDILFFF